MTDAIQVLPVSPLQGMNTVIDHGDHFRLILLGHSVKINLRGDGGAQFASAVEKATGIALPLAANTVNDSPDHQARLIWLGPDEWLFRCEENWQGLSAADWESRLREQLQGEHAAVVDVSDYSVCFQLSGRGARRAMRKLTPLDVDSVLSAPQQCAQTRFANATVLLTQAPEVGDAHFVLQVRWSYAAYLWAHLDEAGAEFRLGGKAGAPA